MASSDKDQKYIEGVKMEYTALRSEAIKRIELRQQLVTFALTVMGVLLGFGVSNGLIALIYPPLALFLAITWLQNDTRIRDVAFYIREKLEKNFPGLGWEKFVQEDREKSRNSKRQRTIWSHGGVFVFTQIIAILVGCLKLSLEPTSIILLGVDLISVVIATIVLRSARR